jgi:hypothetical protein
MEEIPLGPAFYQVASEEGLYVRRLISREEFIMRIAGTALGMLAVILSLAGVGQAQSPLPVSGTIDAVHCQTNVLIINGGRGIELFSVAPNVAVFINSTSASFCTLSQYVGSYAIASASAEGGRREVGRVDVLIPPPVYPFYGSFGVGIPATPMLNRGGTGRR